MVTLTSMGPKLQSQNCVDVDYEKTVGLGAWLIKTLWKSNVSLCLSQKEKSLAWPNGSHLNYLKYWEGIWNIRRVSGIQKCETGLSNGFDWYCTFKIVKQHFGIFKVAPRSLIVERMFCHFIIFGMNENSTLHCGLCNKPTTHQIWPFTAHCAPNQLYNF